MVRRSAVRGVLQRAKAAIVRTVAIRDGNYDAGKEAITRWHQPEIFRKKALAREMLVDCMQSGCWAKTDGTMTVNGKVACLDCWNQDQTKRLDEKFKRQQRPKNDYDWDQ